MSFDNAVDQFESNQNNFVMSTNSNGMNVNNDTRVVQSIAPVNNHHLIRYYFCYYYTLQNDTLEDFLNVPVETNSTLDHTKNIPIMDITSTQDDTHENDNAKRLKHTKNDNVITHQFLF